MKNYLQLARQHARLHKRENRMTIFCIVLAVFLVTGVFSLADAEIEHTTNMLTEEHGNWYFKIINATEEEIEQIKSEVKIDRSGWLSEGLKGDYCLSGKTIVIAGADRTMLEDILAETLTSGKYPESDNQILLSENAKTLFGYTEGDTVIINAPKDNKEYIISGFVKNTSEILAEDCIVGDANEKLKNNIYERRRSDEQIEIVGEQQQNNIDCYIRLKKSLHIKKDIQKLREIHGWDDNKLDENAAVLGIMGMSSGNYVMGLYSVAMILVVMVVLAGVLMISGSMNSNIAQRTQFFGMLRCVGAGKRQIKNLVRLEALNWCKIAIPIGVVAANLGSWIICAILRYVIGGEWANMPVFKISFIGIAVGTIMGIITVLIAANAPAGRAAKVSPINAVSGNANMSKKIKRPVKLKLFKVDTAMGISHAVSVKKNLILMTGSFALSIILFLSFSVMIDWIGHALTSNKPYSPDISIYYEDYGNKISSKECQQIREIDGMKYVYGRMYKYAEIEPLKGKTSIDLISYDDIQFKWAKKEKLSGSIEKVRDEFNTCMVVFDKNNVIELGDIIVYNGQPIVVEALLSDSPFSSSDIPTVICSEKTFTSLTGENKYAVVDVRVTKRCSEESVDKLRNMINPLMKFSDRRASKNEVNSTYFAFSFMVYGFLAFVALISTFNIINSISMSVSARNRQYGIMRAIGLDNRQLAKMVTFEAITYAVSGCVVGCVIGLCVNAYFHKLIIANYWGDAWSLPVPQMVIILAVVIGSALLAVYGPTKRITSLSVTDTINC